MLEKRVTNLTKLLDDFIGELQKEVRVEKVYLYGSYAHNSEHDFSDIDVAVISPDFEGGTERDYLILGRAALKVNPLIEAKPYRPEDLINLSPAEFLAEVLRTGRIVYDKAA
ncbi:MAG: nucleotidyltransferase domain-containing protein [Sideroxyarcus sp.]|nr:nucleotidyltransferase domain-containing protein [Sideroxyarcus sp.]